MPPDTESTSCWYSAPASASPGNAYDDGNVSAWDLNNFRNDVTAFVDQQIKRIDNKLKTVKNGERGPKGDKGDKGDKGAKGDTGNPPSNVLLKDKQYRMYSEGDEIKRSDKCHWDACFLSFDQDQVQVKTQPGYFLRECLDSRSRKATPSCMHRLPWFL